MADRRPEAEEEGRPPSREDVGPQPIRMPLEWRPVEMHGRPGDLALLQRTVESMLASLRVEHNGAAQVAVNLQLGDSRLSMAGVELRWQRGRVVATLFARDGIGRAQLQAMAPQLHQRLSARGVAIDRVGVSVGTSLKGGATWRQSPGRRPR